MGKVPLVVGAVRPKSTLATNLLIDTQLVAKVEVAITTLMGCMDAVGHQPRLGDCFWCNDECAGAIARFE